MPRLIRKVSFIWWIDDIQERAIQMHREPLTDKQASEILQLIKHRHDANIGVNWEVIDIWTNYYLDPNTK